MPAGLRIKNVDTVPDLRDGAVRTRASKRRDEIATPLEEAHRVRRFVVHNTFGAETQDDIAMRRIAHPVELGRHAVAEG